MNFESWINELRSLLACSDLESQEILDYYMEIYGDKKEAGLTDEEILAEFGSPDECVKKIKESDALASGSERAEGLGEKAQQEQKSVYVSQNFGKNSSSGEDKDEKKGNDPEEEKVAVIRKALLTVAMIFATLCIALPVFISLYATTISVIACAVAGLVGALLALLNGFFSEFMPWLATAGVYLATSGACTIAGVYLCKACKFLTSWYARLFKKMTDAKEDKQ